MRQLTKILRKTTDHPLINMLENKKNIEEFYIDLKNRFPKLTELKTWNKYNWRVDGCENSMIMSDLAEEIILWTSNNKLEDSRNFFDYLESCIEVYDERVTSFIYTDFLVTIMETKEKETRELIKKMMLTKTKQFYQRLFQFYSEPN
jgi:hypothetical protein